MINKFIFLILVLGFEVFGNESANKISCFGNLAIYSVKGNNVNLRNEDKGGFELSQDEVSFLFLGSNEKNHFLDLELWPKFKAKKLAKNYQKNFNLVIDAKESQITIKLMGKKSNYNESLRCLRK